MLFRSNRELGNVLMIDPSQVSRVRNGRRKATGVFLETTRLAGFFAGKMRAEYQFHALEKALELPFSLPRASEDLSQVLHASLRERRPGPLASIPESNLISEFHAPSVTEDIFAEVPVQAYFGLAGNEAAKVSFLQAAAAIETPKTVCLFNNDDMVWMKEDTVFSKQKIGRAHV